MAAKVAKLGVLVQPRLLLMGTEAPRNAEPILSLAKRIDDAGLDSVWVGDSLMYNPRPESLTVLGAMAARTSRVRLGTGVLVGALRHPVWLASVMGTVDLISGGRLVLGVGVGVNFTEGQREEWMAEWRAVGVDPSTRASRLEEVVQLVRRLGSGETVTFQGRHFDLNGARAHPRPVQEGGVPILFVCDSPRLRERQLRRAARYGDGVIFGTIKPDDLVTNTEKLRAYAEEEGRDFSKMEVVTSVCINLDRDEARAAREADRFLMGYYRENYWGDSWGPWGPPEKAAERINALAETGATDTIVVRLATFDQERQLETLLSDVTLAIQGA